MSTRANIVIKDQYDKLFFYRHSDGYPSGALPTLNIFLDWVKSGKIRDNVGQAAGWLIIIGAIEYNSIPPFKTKKPHFKGGHAYGDISTIEKAQAGGISEWKAGAYEPTTGIHGDIEYLYVIDLDTKTVKVYDSWTDTGEGKHELKGKALAA